MRPLAVERLLEMASRAFTGSRSKIPVAVVVVADALLKDVPEQFDAPIWDNGRVADALPVLGRSDTDTDWHACAGGKPQALDPAKTDCFGKFVIALNPNRRIGQTAQCRATTCDIGAR
jgi:hypothetical protein